MFHRRNDDLDAARGIINGLILSAYFYIIVRAIWIITTQG